MKNTGEKIVHCIRYL